MLLTWRHQSSRKSAKNGKRKRRRRKPHARPMRSDTAPPNKTIAPRMRTAPKPPSTARCDKPWVCPGKRLAILNFPRSATNPLPLAGRQVRSMARKVPVWQRAWHSIPPPPAMPTTARIVTAAVTRNHPTARTRKCTSKVISHDKSSLVAARADVPAADANASNFQQ